MLPIDQSEDYKKRWPIAQNCGLIRSPDLKLGTPLQVVNRDGLKELSFIFFVGWLFTSILNRSKEKIRLSLLPAGPTGHSAILVLYPPETHLASPSRTQSELFDREYFVCPLDRSGGAKLPDLQRHLCPVVNKLRYNLAHARPEGNVEGLQAPHKTEYCCDSKKQLLWDYLSDTLFKDPELYGPMIGGKAFPINLPFSFLEKYLTGVEANPNDFGKLMEETFLWLAMAASEVALVFPHVTLKVPIKFNEIDLLFYEATGNYTHQETEPAGGWEAYLARHSVCLMEFTIGHHAEAAKLEGAGAGAKQAIGAGKDVPKNKLMNYHAFCSYGFKSTQCYYLTITGEANLAQATLRALKSVGGFRYYCLSQDLNEDIEQLVLKHNDAAVQSGKVRAWHERIIAIVESAAKDFRKSL